MTTRVDMLTSVVLDARAELRKASISVSKLDTVGLDAAALRALTDEARSAARVVDSLIVEIGRKADALAAVGRSGSAYDTLRNDGAISAAEARRQAGRADVANALPGFGEALADGAVDGEHLDAIARATKGLSEEEAGALSDRAEDLVDAASTMPVDAFNRLVKTTVDRIRDDHGAARARSQRASSTARLWRDRHGMGHIHATLDPERFEAMANAIDAEANSLAATRSRETGRSVSKDDHLRADAFCNLISAGSVSAEQKSSKPGGRPHLIIVADETTITSGPHAGTVLESQDGAPLSPEAVQRLCCDATVQRVMTDAAGVPINVGRQHRTATAAQWSALRAMYSTCAFEHCDRPLSWTQAHHVQFWSPNGRTDLDNLVPLCSHHHHLVHEGGWTLTLHPDRALDICRPDGVLHATTRPDRSQRVREGRPPPPERRPCDN